jgi:hypothetical protein
MRLLQLTPQTRLVVGDGCECEKTVLKMPGQKRTILQVGNRLSLSGQQSLYSVDDFIAVGQEQLEQFDMRPERHFPNSLVFHNARPP